jgi:hypothetical protein
VVRPQTRDTKRAAEIGACKEEIHFLKTTTYTSFAILTFLLLLGACGGRSLVVPPFDSSGIESRAAVQSEGLITVRAAVLSPTEAEEMYGVDLYAGGVQPVWIEVRNAGDEPLRFAPVGTDREYFSPLEVAYVNRGGLSKESRDAMNRRFYKSAMRRVVDAGASISGIVLTHAEPGTKGFNVDLFGSEVSFRFTFFLTAPGFTPDHDSVDFNSLYEPADARDVREDALPALVDEILCCIADATGVTSNGLPMNIALIGRGDEVLASLLRARWRETELSDPRNELSGEHFYRGRAQDATMRYEGRNDSDGYYELRLWLSPYSVDGTQIWIGHVRHFINHRWQEDQPGPDIDIARSFLLQNLWYSSALKKYGRVVTGSAIALNESRQDFNSHEYFTDGAKLALWVSGEPISSADVDETEWSDAIVQ